MDEKKRPCERNCGRSSKKKKQKIRKAIRKVGFATEKLISLDLILKRSLMIQVELSL